MGSLYTCTTFPIPGLDTCLPTISAVLTRHTITFVPLEFLRDPDMISSLALATHWGGVEERNSMVEMLAAHLALAIPVSTKFII